MPSTQTLLPPGLTAASPPLLENGDRLSRDEFERRYQAMPQRKKAELLNGIVYLPSPVRLDLHGRPHLLLVTLIGLYEVATPGLSGGDNSTVRLGNDNEPRPDVLLMISGECGGQSHVGVEGYVDGAPELAAEIASSSVSYDLHVKLDVYREYGVREYLVWRVMDRAFDWFALRDGAYEPIPADDQGVVHSEVFPGLWLDVDALLRGDGARAVAVLQQGIASPEHAEFVARLSQNKAATS